MKRVIAFTLILALGFVSFVWAEPRTSSKSVMVSHKQAKIRNGPATSYLVLWRPRLYTPLEVLSKFTDEKGQLWYPIRDVEGDVGWIHNSTVIKKPSAIVIVNMANVRREGNSKAQVLFQAPKNYTFKILQNKKGWYKVEDPEGDKGWIPKKNVWTGRTPKPKKGPRLP